MPKVKKIKIDSEKLCKFIKAAGYKSLPEFSDKCGYSDSAIYRPIKAGEMTYLMANTFAHNLHVDVAAFEAKEPEPVAEEKPVVCNAAQFAVLMKQLKFMEENQ